jgi:dehydrogenase/reductase SDR family protein 1
VSRQLKGKIALVTGGSRGIGKGIALGLGQAGATVYVTGRTVENGRSKWPGTITETSEEVTKLGGRGIAIPCDHGKDGEVQAVFKRVRDEQNQLDILVNNATSFGETPSSHGYDPMDAPFWKLPISQWDEMLDVGLRSHYVASVLAAQIMTPKQNGVIINISSNGAKQYAGNVAYGVGKAAVEKLASDMAHQLRQYNVASISIWPPLTRTEKVMAFKEQYDLKKAYSPLFTGLAVVALAADPKVMDKTGLTFRVTDLAAEYGFSDNSSVLG